MIIGKKKTPIVYKRIISYNEKSIDIDTRITNVPPNSQVILNAFFVPIYTANSNFFQKEMIKMETKKFAQVNNKFRLKESIKF